MIEAWTRGLSQTATYWPPGSNDGYGGVAFGDPVIVRCRWQNVSKLFMNSAGEQLVSSAVIYVDQELSEKGRIALGEATDAMPTAASREVRGTSSSPSLDARTQSLKVWL